MLFSSIKLNIWKISQNNLLRLTKMISYSACVLLDISTYIYIHLTDMCTYVYMLYVYTTLDNFFTCSRHVTCFMSNNDLNKSEDEISTLGV